jgi:hypothetical protein
MEPATVTSSRWTAFQKTAFRFFGIYFFIYAIPMSFQVNFIWDPLVYLAGKALNVQYEKIEFTGSGDTTYDYLQVFALLCISFTGCIVWSALDRKRGHYNKLLYWLIVLMRYSLAFTLIVYGAAKIFKSQFPAPYLFRLVQPFGEASPMGLAWTFLGYSYGYNLFMGFAEAIGGFLLLFRRTTSFGALFSITVLTNVFVMNLFFDIPVKLFSFHLLLMAMFIAIPDVRRLIRFFFTNKTIAAPPPPAFTYKPQFVIWKGLLKILVIGLVVVQQTISGLSEMEVYGDSRPKGPLYGIYNVQTFVKNNDTLPPLTTDSVRWRRLIIDGEYGRLTKMNDSSDRFEISVDTAKGRITFTGREDSTVTQLSYKAIDTGTLLISGIMDADTLHVLLKRKNLDDYLLISRGFHWVNEYPLNR